MGSRNYAHAVEMRVAHPHDVELPGKDSVMNPSYGGKHRKCNLMWARNTDSMLQQPVCTPTCYHFDHNSFQFTRAEPHTEGYCCCGYSIITWTRTISGFTACNHTVHACTEPLGLMSRDQHAASTQENCIQVNPLRFMLLTGQSKSESSSSCSRCKMTRLTRRCASRSIAVSTSSSALRQIGPTSFNTSAASACTC